MTQEDETLELLLRLAAEGGVALPDHLVDAAADGLLPGRCQALAASLFPDAIAARRARDEALFTALRRPGALAARPAADPTRVRPSGSAARPERARTASRAPARWMPPQPLRIRPSVVGRLSDRATLHAELVLPLENADPAALVALIRVVDGAARVFLPSGPRGWLPVSAFVRAEGPGLLLTLLPPPGHHRYVVALVPPGSPLLAVDWTAPEPERWAALEAAITEGRVPTVEAEFEVAAPSQ